MQLTVQQILLIKRALSVYLLMKDPYDNTNEFDIEEMRALFQYIAQNMAETVRIG
jgi:hypothetical protein